MIISRKTRVLNALHRAMQEIQQGIGDSSLSERDKKILKLADKHNDHAYLKIKEMSRVDDDLDEFAECENCGTLVHEGPCVSEDPFEVALSLEGGSNVRTKKI